MTTASYIFDLKELAEGKPPAFAAAGRPGENIPIYATLALVESIRVMAAEMATMNGHLVKLVEATKGKAP